MRLLRGFPIMVLGLVMLSIVGFCAATSSVQLLLIAVTLTAVSWYVTEGPRGRTLPRWVTNLLVLAATMSVLVDVTLPPNEVGGVLGRFGIWLTLIKLYERRTARDHAHLMALSLLLVIVGCMETQAMFFGIVLILYAALGLYTLLLYQLYAAGEAESAVRRAALAAANPAAAGRAPAVAARPAVGRHAALQFRSLAGGIAVAGFALSAGLFLIFPRSVGRGMISARLHLPASPAVSGYTDEITLDAGTRITDSPSVVFDVRITGPGGRPEPAGAPLLFRGAVLDEYSGGQWRAARGRSAGRRVETDGLGAVRLDTAVSGAGPLRRQAYRFRNGTTTVFALAPAATIETSRPHRFRYDPQAGTLRSADVSTLWEYTVESWRRPPQGAPPLPDGPAGAISLGADEAPVHELAVDLLERAGLPAAPPRPAEPWEWNLDAAGAFRGYLRSDAYRYTLDVGDVVPGDRDPIAWFLLQSHRGHCEFYASALAALCHSVGIPVRVVSGYVGTEYDRSTGRYIVRDRHAHAWTEVRSGPARYTAIDPTPPRILTAPAPGELTLSRRLGRLYQRLEGNWTSGVIQFDQGAQSRLLDTVGARWSQAAAGTLRATRAWMRRVNRAFHLGPAGYIWLGIVALAAVIALIAMVNLLRRRRLLRRTLRLEGARGAESRRLIRQLGFYADMLAVLARGACPKPRWQPPLAFARAVARRRPEAAVLVRRITDLYYKSRYAGRALDGEALARAQRLVHKLEAALARRPRA